MSKSSESNQAVVGPEKPKPSRRRRYLFRLIAVLLALTPFVVLELILAVLGVGEPGHYDDPFVGFSSIHPLFELDEKEENYITAPSRQLYFGPQSLAARKPQNGYRVFCLGGSTVRGRPHETDTAFPKWLELELQDRHPARDHEVVNCGGVSYASYRLRPILKEVLDYQPDLIVLATGHNEFLEDRTYQKLKAQSQGRRWLTDRIYSLRTVTLARQLFSKSEHPGDILATDVKARLDDESGYASYHRDDRWWEGVIEHYRAGIETMIRLCREKKVPLILVNLGENLRDCPPFKSEHRPNLTEEEKTTWQTNFDLATVTESQLPIEESGQPPVLQHALSFYRKAEAIDNEHALLLFRIARCLDRLGKYSEAKRYYIQAKEWDICPLRMKDKFHETLRLLAQEHQVPLIDIQDRIEKQASQQIPGFDMYVDHVHPTIGNHQLIAQALFEEIEHQGLLPPSEKPWTPSHQRSVLREYMEQLPPNFLSGGRQRIEWLENWARRERMENETAPINAAGYARLGYRHLEISREEDGFHAFETAILLTPTVQQELSDHMLRYIREGRPKLAQVILKSLIDNPLTEDNRKNYYLIDMILAREQKDRSRYEARARQYSEVPAPTLKLSKEWSPLIEETLDGSKASGGR